MDKEIIRANVAQQLIKNIHFEREVYYNGVLTFEFVMKAAISCNPV